MIAVEVGSRWFIWGEVRQVIERVDSYRGGEWGPTVCAPPEDRAKKKPHWTDWIEAARVEKHGQPLAPGEIVKPRRRRATAEIIEEAATKARKTTSVVTPERRLQNRITSTRYRIKHPEKSARPSGWTPLELAEMEALITATKDELESLRGGVAWPEK